jgi:hypothetical protein
MVVNRRRAIRQILCVSAGAVFIPACLQDKSKSSILLKNMKLNASQENLLAELSDLIIPATSTPGAKDLYAHLFALKMLDDCFTKEKQQQFLNGMKQFEDGVQKKYSTHFLKCSAEKKKAILADLESNKKSNDDIAFFYTTMKRLIIQGYTSSQYYLTNVQVYEMVPGRYHGCVPVTNTSRKAS